MCAVSMIFDQTPKQWDWRPGSTTTWTPPYIGPTKEQFEEFLELLRAAKKQDEAANTPDCGDEKKLAKIRKILTPAQFSKVRAVLGS